MADRALAVRFWPRVDTSGGPGACWPWLGARNDNGYGSFYVDGKKRGSHRVAFELANGVGPKGLLVCHSCDTPACCNPAHLWLGTSRDNTQDCIRKGRFPSGDRNGIRRRPERHPARLYPGWHPLALRPERRARGAAMPNAKLDDEKVREIRASTATERELAMRYGVGTALIGQVRRRKAWRHVQ